MQNPGNRYAWDDVRCLLAVARHGGTLGAARVLGVNQTTVQRRVAALEQSFGQPLVHRLPTGYRLTAFAERLLPLAERLERSASDLAQEVERARLDLAGVVRVTGPDPIVYRINQSGLLDRFHQRYPAIRVEFLTGDRFFDLQGGEADIALRAGDGDDQLVGREIGLSHWAIYGSRSYVQRCGAPQDVDGLAGHSLLGLGDEAVLHTTAQWMLRKLPAAKVVGRTNNMLGLVYAVRSGVGLAPLPMTLGESEPELVRVLGPIPELSRTWRLLTTRELRATPRVAALFEYLAQEMDALRKVLLEPVRG